MDRNTLIERYFEGRLTPQEQSHFDQLMETDSSFSEAVAFEKKTKIAVTLEAREKMKSQFQEWEAKNQTTPSRKYWLYIAASIAILLGVTLFVFKQNPTADALYASYFEPYPNTVAPIVRNATEKSLESDAFAAYEKGDFQQASELFKALSKTSDEEYISFYQAISMMELEQSEKAEQIFTSTQWSEPYKERADWYLALNYLHQNKIAQANSVLEKIVKNKTYKFEEATKLLQKTKKL